MFTKKDNIAGNDHDPTPPQPTRPAAPQYQPLPAAPPRASVAPTPAPAPADSASSIGIGMTVIGKLVGDGALKVFGRVEGELQVANLIVGEGAVVEGSIIAKDLAIAGRVKGTIHAVRVKLSGSAVVEGDIFHRSLAIEENARFEGTSRREENHPDKPMSAPVRSPLAVAPPQAGLHESNGRLDEQARQ